MNYKNSILITSMCSILFMCGCGNGDVGGDAHKDSTVPQGEIVNQSDKKGKEIDNISLLASTNEGKKLNYKIVSERYTNGKINIEYPQINGLNTEEEVNINKKIKDLVYNVESQQDFDPINITNEEKFEIKTQNQNFISIFVKGYSYREGAARPYGYVRTYNIDLSEGTMKRLVDTGKTEEYASKIFDGTGFKIKGEDAMKEELNNQSLILNDVGGDLLYRKGYEGKSEHEIKQMLDKFDTDVNNLDYVPSGYSYYEDGKTVLCVEVNHALGDYLELVFD